MGSAGCPQGICVITGLSSLARLSEHLLLGAWMSKTGSKQIGFQGVASVNNKDLVIINADKDVTHGLVVSAMDEARKAGVTRFAIATDKGS